MTEQATVKTALDVAREWLDARAHAEDCRIVRIPLSECDCRNYEPLAKAIESYAQAAVQECRAGRQDGECNWRGCPQLRDGEPHKTGRDCPLYVWRDDE